jgi:hypothetical protein
VAGHELGGDGGGVEVAEAAERAVLGVVAGRPDQGVGEPRAGQDLFGGGEGAVDGGAGGEPGVRFRGVKVSMQ